jgi:hypothetical protein
LGDVLLVFLAMRPFFAGNAWVALFSDANVGLHIRTGDLIRATGHAPASEPFSFSLPGQPWFAWEWVTATGLSWIHSFGGLAAVGVVAVALITAWTALTLRNCVLTSRQWIPALALTMVGFEAASIHLLARPHLITWVLLAGAIGLMERERVQPSYRLWLLAPLTVLWANLHGGFPTLVVYLFLLAGGLGAEALWHKGEWRPAIRFAAAGVLALAASLVNPFGIRLHLHIFQYIRSPWLVELVEEYHAPSPALGEPYYWFLGLTALAAAAAVSIVRRRGVAGALLLGFFGWSALQSARHIPIFVTVALPLIAGEIARWFAVWRQRSGEKGVAAVIGGFEAEGLAQFSRHSLVAPVWLVTALWYPALLGAPGEFPEKHFPIGLVGRHSELLQSQRLLTTDAWGDYVAYKGFPRTRVFVDGMNDFFGPALGRDYLEMLDAGPRTGELFARWQFDTALVPAGKPLSLWLRQQGDWRLVEATTQAELFVRTPGGRETPVRPSTNGHPASQ